MQGADAISDAYGDEETDRGNTIYSFHHSLNGGGIKKNKDSSHMPPISSSFKGMILVISTYLGKFEETSLRGQDRVIPSVSYVCMLKLLTKLRNTWTS